jgi:ABC-type molybdate transport system substrate-binding protein
MRIKGLMITLFMLLLLVSLSLVGAQETQTLTVFAAA